MTTDELTFELGRWSATLPDHKHPPVILERLRVASPTGTVPLDWADHERADLRMRQTRIRDLKAAEAQWLSVIERAPAGMRRSMTSPVVWAP